MEKELFYEYFVRSVCANCINIEANELLCRQFFELTEHLLQVNAHMNVTAITEPREMILRHYIDSLTLLPYLPEGATVLDVGCGGGFPCLPLAIARPDLHITALDSTDKKVRHVNDTAALLGVDGRLQAITARAEEAAAPGAPLREHFDVVVSRAVARLEVLDELCLPFLRVGGTLIAMKGARAAEEYTQAARGMTTLGAAEAELVPCTIHAPDDADASADLHTLVIAKKVRKTAEIYPRKYAQILKKPL